MATYEFTNPITATVRFTINTNADGNIATENDTIAGSKTMNFTYTKLNATAQEIIHGTTMPISLDPKSGIGTTFIGYLLGGSIVENATRRTIIQTVGTAA